MPRAETVDLWAILKTSEEERPQLHPPAEQSTPIRTASGIVQKWQFYLPMSFLLLSVCNLPVTLSRSRTHMKNFSAARNFLTLLLRAAEAYVILP
jgi:hypothetical protein